MSNLTSSLTVESVGGSGNASRLGNGNSRPQGHYGDQPIPVDKPGFHQGDYKETLRKIRTGEYSRSGNGE